MSPWIDARTSVSAPATWKPFSFCVSWPRTHFSRFVSAVELGVVSDDVMPALVAAGRNVDAVYE